ECDVLQIDRSSARYLSRRGDDADLWDAIKRFSRERRRFRCRRIQVMVAREGFEVNQKKLRHFFMLKRRDKSIVGAAESALWA
ncbi:MAG: hypothetical protein O3C11_14535, partial [Proteobacteria bacterium]|nr:hypothetical protein [Pseudomonadota bacterium]